MKKTVVVINGAGGVGKDTLCDMAAKHFKVRNISSVTPIKEIARMCGWSGAKDDKSRKFLADLKQLCAEYNNFPTVWAKAQYDDFLTTDEQILFVHIREGNEIKKFVDATLGKAKTLLVRGGERMKRGAYGNAADDQVENYSYDYYYDNDKSLDQTEKLFVALMERMLEE